MSYKRSLPVRSEISVLFLNNLTADRMYCCHDPENFLQNVKTPLSQTPQTFFELFIQLLKFTQNFVHFQKNDQVHSSNIYEVIKSEQCGDLNAPKILFQNILPESTCSCVPNTSEICTAPLLSKFPINDRQIELENISVNQI